MSSIPINPQGFYPQTPQGWFYPQSPRGGLKRTNTKVGNKNVKKNVDVTIIYNFKSPSLPGEGDLGGEVDNQ